MTKRPTARSENDKKTARFVLALAQIILGYVLIAVFFVFFVLLSRNFADLSVNQRLILAAVLTVPLIVPAVAILLKDLPISGLRVSTTGFEVALDRVSSKVPALMSPELENMIAAEVHASGNEAMKKFLPHLASSFTVHQQQAVTLNLEPIGKPVPYWWSTRLFLVAAILEDRTAVRTIYFVDGGKRRRYAGRVATVELQNRFTARWPELQVHYDKCESNANSIEELIDYWAMWPVQDQTTKNEVSEEEFKEVIGAKELIDVLGAAMDCYSIDRAESRGPTLHHRILNWGTNFVPLTIGGRLDRVVDAHALARDLSITALEQYAN